MRGVYATIDLVGMRYNGRCTFLECEYGKMPDEQPRCSSLADWLLSRRGNNCPDWYCDTHVRLQRIVCGWPGCAALVPITDPTRTLYCEAHAGDVARRLAPLAPALIYPQEW